MKQQLETASATYPNAAHLIEGLLDDAAPIFSPLITWSIEKNGQKFWRLAERLATSSAAAGGRPAEALIEYTISYLREQALFMTSKEYSNTSFDAVREAVYDNPDVMKRFYLDGLMLTHAFWPVHFDIHELFLDEFVSRIPDGSRGAEFGYGHGLYLLEILERRPNTEVQGYDISTFAMDYAARLFQLAGIDRSRYSFAFGDVRTKSPAADGEFAWGILAEVLEHIPDPAFALSELRRGLATGAPAFITTVLESNAIDHIYCFESAEQVRRMIESTGFSVTVERAFRVRDYGSARDPSINLVFICKAI